MLSYSLPLSSELEYCGVAFRFGGFEAADLELVLFALEPDGPAEDAPSLARSDEPFGRCPPTRGWCVLEVEATPDCSERLLWSNSRSACKR